MPSRGRSTMRRILPMLVLTLLAALSACAPGHDRNAEARSVQEPASPPPAKGETVSELGSSVMYVFHARNNDYWFGSNDRGAYRYDGTTIVNFTTKDGLASNQI